MHHHAPPLSHDEMGWGEGATALFAIKAIGCILTQKCVIIGKKKRVEKKIRKFLQLCNTLKARGGGEKSDVHFALQSNSGKVKGEK